MKQIYKSTHFRRKRTNIKDKVKGTNLKGLFATNEIPISKEIESRVSKNNLYSHVYSVLVMTCKSSKEPKYPLIDTWINKMWYLY